MRLISLKSFLWIVLLLAAYTVASQFGYAQFEKVTFNQKENLGTVYSIFKDKQGFIWLGTSTGLKRYDGVNLKSYRFDPLDTSSISSNEVRSIQEDKNGDLWIGTINKGINKFLRSEEKFIRYDKSQNGNNFLKEDIVPQLLYKPDNQLWACVWGAGLAYFDEVKKIFKYIEPDSNEISPTLSKHIRSILPSRKDSNIFWVGTREGLLKFDRKLKKYFPLYTKDIPSGSALSGFIFFVAEDKDNRLWIGSQNKGFCNFDPDAGNISKYGFNKNTGVLSLAPDNYGNVWIGTAGDGIYLFEAKEKTLTNFIKQKNNLNSLPSNNISSLFVCDEEIVWIGTAGSGLARIVSANKQFIQFNPTKKSLEFNKDEYVSHIFEDDNKDIWLCGADGQVFVYNVSHDKVEPLFNERGIRPRSKIYSVSSAENNKYLIATFKEGFFVYDKKSGELLHKKLYPDHSDLWQANKVTSFLKASQGKYYIGTDGAGLFEYDLNTNNINQYNDNMPNVWALFRDESDNVWVGTWGNGLFRFNESTNKIENFYPAPNDKSFFTSTTTVCIKQDNKGNLWFGTQGDGIFLLEHDKIVNPVFKNFNSSNGIPEDLIMGIVAEDENNIWISTQAGLARYDYNKKTFASYGQKEGIEQLEFNLGSILRASDNNLYFGSLEGTYLTNKRNYLTKQNTFNIVITDVKLFNIPIRFYNKNYPSTEYESLALNYNQNFLSFEFAPLNYSDPSKVVCEYKLEGVDEDWLKDGGRRFANYTDLPPGKYKFIVRILDVENNAAISFASIVVNISPPIWATWYAYALYITVFIGALLFIRKYEMEKRAKKAREQLRKNKEDTAMRELKLQTEAAEFKARTVEQEKEIEKQKIRNRIARDLHDEIGSNLSSISLLSRMLKDELKSDGELSQNLSRIESTAKNSVTSIRDIVWFINPSSDSLIDLIRKMNETSENLLKETECFFHHNIPDTDKKISPEIKRGIYLIFKETLNNISKHSGADKVNINVNVDNNEFYLTIDDNGKGFNVNETYNGNGINNIKSRADELSATLTIQSEIGKGSGLVLKLQMAQTRD
ncbi:MAG TPA: two-component regulator propeller domain-containing protein [Ignavibacteriaceae bacterium]|nr:two-component regulator propeller domain-containing protein [Ignavibacteriaceae bacterium]